MGSRPSAFALARRRFLIGAAFIGIAGPVRAAAEFLTFGDLYKSFGVRGFAFSDRVMAVKGRAVTLTGYMAPPLKPESAFFVLTREPLAICPFCQSDADWPMDIVVVYLDRASPFVSAGSKVAVTGRLEIGSSTDPETGFISQIRLIEASYRTA